MLGRDKVKYVYEWVDIAYKFKLNSGIFLLDVTCVLFKWSSFIHKIYLSLYQNTFIDDKSFPLFNFIISILLWIYIKKLRKSSYFEVFCRKYMRLIISKYVLFILFEWFFWNSNFSINRNISIFKKIQYLSEIAISTKNIKLLKFDKFAKS